MLARKSRKNLMESEVVKCDLLKAAGYVRLSVNKDAHPSDSIDNQKKLIEDYVKTNLDIQLVRFYVDDKVSGRDFDRPAFNEMLDDIQTRKVNCVIVKDLSRLGREMIEVGYYVQMFFPSKQVRFISIGNQIDTLDGMTNITFGKLPGDRIPLASLMDEQYAIDISKKTQFVLNDYIKDGKYVAPRAPYGYIKSESDCHVLVPDVEAATVVRDIFAMAARKTSINEVVRRLNTVGILTPINYAIAHGLKGNYNRGNGLWSSRTVKDILTNRVYVGDLEQGKDKYLVQNTHEPLVSREIFDIVQELFATNIVANPSKTNTPRQDNVLRGKVICGCCGGKMQRRKGSGNVDWHFFTCISNNRKGVGSCTGMYIRESDIMDAIRREVRTYVQVNTALASTYKNEMATLTAKAKQLDFKINQLMEMNRSRYEDYIMGIAKKDEMQQCRGEYEPLQAELQDTNTCIEILDHKNQQYQLFCDARDDKDRIRQLAADYLQYVTVFFDGRIEVDFKH
ncbi:recombinase family protein [Eubacteriales bacterium OttesenSCG-928-M02]|nr:recombinase family protein [Eubacteriales bacterium OttesenSCG-928-M02]